MDRTVRGGDSPPEPGTPGMWDLGRGARRATPGVLGSVLAVTLVSGCSPLVSTTGEPESDTTDDGERPSTPGMPGTDATGDGGSTGDDGDGNGDGDGDGTGNGDGDGDGDDPCLSDSPEGVCLFPWANVGAGGVPTGVALGDLDSDTRPEVAVAMFTGDGVEVWSLDGTGSLQSLEFPDAGAGYRGVALTDVDGDGVRDLVGVHPTLQLLTVYRGGGDGTFSLLSSTNLTGNPRAVWPAQMDDDVGDELVVLLESQGVSVVELQGTMLATLGGWTGEGTFYDGVVADMDQDGRQDVVLSDEAGDRLLVLLGDGMGGLMEAAQIPASTAPRGVAAGDLDLDGDMDLVVTTFGDDRMKSLLRSGTEDLVFTPGSDVALGLGPYSVRLVDMDLDGDLDAVAPVSGLNAVAVVLNDGAGVLEERLPFLTGSSPIDVRVHDWNLDGRPDLVVSNAGGQSLTVLGSTPRYP